MIYLRLIITFLSTLYIRCTQSQARINDEVSFINVPDIVSPIFKLSNDIE